MQPAGEPNLPVVGVSYARISPAWTPWLLACAALSVATVLATVGYETLFITADGLPCGTSIYRAEENLYFAAGLAGLASIAGILVGNSYSIAWRRIRVLYFLLALDLFCAAMPTLWDFRDRWFPHY